MTSLLNSAATRVTGAHWDDVAGRWTVTTDQGEPRAVLARDRRLRCGCEVDAEADGADAGGGPDR